ncbi:lysosome membrane protein 2-like [Dysidea avara]|uniref:lysosome membrane protein 2-like n=1 Tax=Dysidea avara TaxID=196820 RepID=UPI00332D6911
MAIKKEKTLLCCCSCWFIVFLVVAGLFGGLFATFPFILEKFVEKQVAIVPGSTQTKNWITPPVPLYATFTFLNINNPKEVSNGAKPNLTDIGPFYYKYFRNKFNVTWDEDESRVSYNLDTYYVFDEEKTGKLGDPCKHSITTINVPLLGLLLQFESMKKTLIERGEEELVDILLKYYYKDTELFYTKRACDILWGYNDPVLELLKTLKLTDMTVFSLETNHSTNDSLGWSTVRTGKYDPKLVGYYTQWNSLREIAPWNSSAARKLDGTGGYMFHPNVKHDDVLRAFVTELFRSGAFVRSRDATVEGIDLFHYIVADYEFYNASAYPPNYGYSAFGKPGVLNLTAVFPQNLPVFVSLPHFLGADQSYLDGVIGMKPNRSIHEAFLEVEPMTGAVLHAAKRLQFNVQLNRDTNVKQLKNIRKSTMFPWFIATEESVITPSKADEFKKDLLDPIRDIHIGLIVAVGVFGLLTIILFLGTVYSCIRYWNYKKQDQAGSINSRTPLLSATTLLTQTENST